MPLGAVLSETDKAEIRTKLQAQCEHFLIRCGYKKTSIKALCASTGISIGTFYSLYPTKEDLFFETIELIQQRLTRKLLDITKSDPTKAGFAQAMKILFREYDSKPFLYNVNTADFQAFATKLPEAAMAKIKLDSMAFFRQLTAAANLRLKLDESQAYGVLSALLATVSAKETLSATCDYVAVFDYMADNLVTAIFD